jgi:hypothetical protein
VHQEMSKRALGAINAVHIFARDMQQPPSIVQHMHENTQNVTTNICENTQNVTTNICMRTHKM